jgi:hypothetical protein
MQLTIKTDGTRVVKATASETRKLQNAIDVLRAFEACMGKDQRETIERLEGAIKQLEP